MNKKKSCLICKGHLDRVNHLIVGKKIFDEAKALYVSFNKKIKGEMVESLPNYHYVKLQVFGKKENLLRSPLKKVVDQKMIESSEKKDDSKSETQTNATVEWK